MTLKFILHVAMNIMFIGNKKKVTWALKMAQKGVVVDGYSADLRLNGDV